MTLTVIPLKARYQKSEFDLFNEITPNIIELTKHALKFS